MPVSQLRLSTLLFHSLMLALLALPSSGLAQGLLVDIGPDRSIRLPRPWPPHRPTPQPAPPSSYKIKSLTVHAKLQGQVAQVQVSQSFVNTGSRPMEVCFVFPLPYDGAVDRLTLLVDGQEYPAQLLDATKARAMYEEIVRKNKDPALLEWVGSGLFKTSVFPVPAGAERTVTLRYSQLCRKDQGLTDFLFPLSTAKYTSQPVDQVEIELSIASRDEIKNVYSPTHAVDVRRPDGHHATVRFTAEKQIPGSDFRLLYDVGRDTVGASVLSYRPTADEDGYFLLLASPKITSSEAERPAKTVVFVVDRSGSMSGKKIEQAKGALKFVLNNLRPGDLFNVIAYDSEVESFRPELQKYDETTRQTALGFVAGIHAGGSTNIDGALAAALRQLQDTSRPSYVIFLTDGLPTAGETNEAKIVAHTKPLNRVRARLFTFGVGYDVNSRLLDKLARANFGQSEYVRPDEDIEAGVSKLYNRIGAPVMTELAIRFELDGHTKADGPVVDRIYPQGVHDLFAGEQLVLVGRYRHSGQAKVKVTGTVADQRETFDFPASLVTKSSDQTNRFIEKLWAMRRVGEILDEIDLKGKNDELVKELVTLATKHGILTPYTSFLADENSNHRDVASARARASRELEALDAASGRDGFAQRKGKAALQRAAQAPSSSFGGSFYYSAREDKRVAVRSIRSLGGKTFFRRADRWVDSAVQAADEKQAQTIARFSDEYFELIDRHGPHAARLLAFDEPVLLRLGEEVYWVK